MEVDVNRCLTRIDDDMSVEAIAPFNCIFCKIVSNSAPASIAYEDDFSLAFLDLRQLSPGHTLLIPQKHVADVRDLDEETGRHFMAALSKVTRAVSAAFPSQGISVLHST